MTFNLFIDDIRNPDWHECQYSGVDPGLNWTIVRTSQEAIEAVQRMGMMPDRIALDHDLGELFDGSIDNVPRFLKWLANEFWDGTMKIPDYTIHSANPVGVKNMISFMESWKKSVSL